MISLAFRLHKTLDEILAMPSSHVTLMAAYLRLKPEDLSEDGEAAFLKVFGNPNGKPR